MNHNRSGLHWIHGFCIVTLFFCCLYPAPLFAADAESALFEEGVQMLYARDFKVKGQGIEKIARSRHEKAEPLLSALLAGKLYMVKKDKTLVYAKVKGSSAEIIEVMTDTPGGIVKKRKLGKITINNALRTKIKNVLASINLTNPDPAKRLDAVNKLTAGTDSDAKPMLMELLSQEKDKKVRKALATAISIVDLQSPEKEVQLQALDQLNGNINPSVLNALKAFAASEKDVVVQKKAQSAINSIEAKISLYGLFETIFFGLSLGSVLVLAAIGLAITFGVIGVINMAHGELIMLGAYTTYVLQQLLPGSIGIALIISIPAAFAVSAATGIVIERSVIRFLYGRPLETLLATFGISLILQQAVRSIFSPLNRSVATPAWLSGSLQINPILSLTTNRIAILIFSLFVFSILFMTLKKSAMGLQVRAVSQNRAMARAMGVRASRVDALTFGLGSGIAGVAGVALSQLTNVGPNLGQAYIIDSFMVVVFGGVGNLWGTLLGGLSLGVANKFLEPWAGAVLAKILILVFIILFIQKRPQGLFPQKGRAAG